MNVGVLRESKGHPLNGGCQFDATGERIIAVEDGIAKAWIIVLLKKQTLGLKVLFQTLMEIQVILAEIGENRHGEGTLIDAMKKEGVGRDLHDASRAPRSESLIQDLLDVHRLRSRPL